MKRRFKMDVQEIKAYLKDAYELESQLFTLNRLKEEYENTYEELEELKKEPLYVNEYFDGTREAEKEHGLMVAYNARAHEEMQQDDFLNKWIHIEHLRPNWTKTPEYKEIFEARKPAYKKANSELRTRKIVFAILVLLVSPTLLLPFTYDAFYWFVPFLDFAILAIIYNKFINDFNSSQYVDYEPLFRYEKLMYKQDMTAKELFYQERINVVVSEYKDVILESIIQTEKTLEKVYSKNIIHPKYRNLIAVGQIYEYFDTGRCNEFEGANGAYNLFESELRQNIIINKLDTIISQLDTLNETMYYIANEIRRSNMLLADISCQLGTISTTLTLIEQNTALTAYNSQCIASNTSIAGRYY